MLNQQHKLLIDEDCPMCRLYGKCFVKFNLMDKNSISSYQTIPSIESIDMQKAKNEIALYDATTNKTLYGVDSLFKILTHNNSALNSLLNLKFIKIIASLSYKFISYNRKVIYPVADSGPAIRSCVPDVNLRYRWAFIIMVAICTALILNQFTTYLLAPYGIEGSLCIEFMVCFGQILWQAVVVNTLFKEKTINYLGNMSTVSLIGGLMLLPLLTAASLVSLPPFVFIMYFASVVTGMLLEHIRRCKLLDLSLSMTLSWVTYRIVALILIFWTLNLFNKIF